MDSKFKRQKQFDSATLICGLVKCNAVVRAVLLFSHHMWSCCSDEHRVSWAQFERSSRTSQFFILCSFV